MGRQVWTALLVVALTTASSLQFTVIDHVPTPNDISQKSPATWRPSGEYRRTECNTLFQFQNLKQKSLNVIRNDAIV